MVSQHNENFSAGNLFVVSTPLGNLEDITVRAIDTLGRVALIVCEDTRKTRILLKRWGICTPLMSLHRFSEARKTQVILNQLREGKNIALVSDAGTPAVSDPGTRLVGAALNGGIKVSPIPGPCSIIAALSVSGMDASAFAYLGFVPRKPGDCRVFFESLKTEHRTSVFFETPQRIVATLRIASEVLGSREMVIFRELTKIYEEVIPGTVSEVLQVLENREVVKGEITLVVKGSLTHESQIDSEQAVVCLMSEGFSGKRLAEEAARRFGIKKSQAYKKFLEMIKSTIAE